MADNKPKMIYRHLGKAGIKVSVLSYGNWLTGGKTDDEETYKILVASHSRGVNLIDTAEVYGMGAAEVSIGKAFKRGIDEEKWKRSDWVFSTKLYKGGSGVNDEGLSRKHIIEGMAGCLKRLQLDYVDLIFAHRPDTETPMEETCRAFSHLLDTGKAFYWGTSEWETHQLLEAEGVCRRYHLNPPTMEQPQYNLLVRDRVEKDYRKLYDREIGLGLTIWSPLKSGMLTGKYNNGIPEDSRFAKNPEFFKDTIKKLESEEGKKEIDKVKKLTEIAKEIGCSMTQLALVWCAANEHVSTVLLGASKAEQIEENLDAIKFLSALTPELLERIEEIVQSKPVIPKPGYGR